MLNELDHLCLSLIFDYACHENDRTRRALRLVCSRFALMLAPPTSVSNQSTVQFLCDYLQVVHSTEFELSSGSQAFYQVLKVELVSKASNCFSSSSFIKVRKSDGLLCSERKDVTNELYAWSLVSQLNWADNEEQVRNILLSFMKHYQIKFRSCKRSAQVIDLTLEDQPQKRQCLMSQ